MISNYAEHVVFICPSLAAYRPEAEIEAGAYRAPHNSLGNNLKGGGKINKSAEEGANTKLKDP